jgi:hypothetical protein
MALFTGTAEPNATVELDLGNGTNLVEQVDAQGHWYAWDLLADGHYAVKAVTRDRAGNASPVATLSFDRSTPDDFGNDANHAAPLGTGSSISGAINYAGDSDWFKLSLQELTVYTVALKAAKVGAGTLPWPGYASPAQLMLWDPQANGGAGAMTALSGSATSDADLAATLPVTHSGDYYLGVSAPNQLGSYVLGVAAAAHDDYAPDPAHAAVAPFSGTIGGRFDFSGDTDTFKVHLAAGATYQFDLAPGAAIDRYNEQALTLTDAAGHALAVGSETATHHMVLSYAPAVAGDYYLSALYMGTVLGSYQLSSSSAADDFGASVASAGKLAIGATVHGSIEVSGDRDWFAVNLQAGTAYTFEVDQGNQGGWSSLVLRDATGADTGRAAPPYNHGALLNFTPTTSGTWFLDVGNAMYGNVAYALQARPGDTDDYGNNAAGAGVIVPGQAASGRLEMPGDVDWFKFTGKANTAYSFELHPIQQGMSGSLQGGEEIAVLDSAGRVQARGTFDGATVRLTWQAGNDGDYYLSVKGYNETFSYTISSATNDQDRYPGNANTTGTLSPGGVIHGTVDFTGDTDWFRVDLQAGQQYTFQMTGARQAGGTLEAPEMVLYDSNKSQLWIADGNVLTDPLKSFTPTTSGTYYLQAGPVMQGWNPGTGTYTLQEGTAAVPIADAPPVALTVYGPSVPDSSPATDNLSISFSEPIMPGSGSATLRLSSGALVEKFDVATSPRVSLGLGNSLVIDPSAPLAYGIGYRIDLDATAVKDLAGNPLAAPFSGTFSTVEQSLHVVGGTGNEVYYNSNGSDSVDGGAGLDTVVYKDASSAHHVRLEGQTVIVESADHDYLLNVERVVFNDHAIAFDLDGTAGQAYRLYRAAFNRVPDSAGLGFWIAQMDKGTSLHEAAQNFIASAEFKNLYGAAPSDQAYANAMYFNVLHRQPDQAGLDYWTGMLAHGVDRTDVLVAFSTSAENQAAVIGQISQGISYLPYY